MSKHLDLSRQIQRHMDLKKKKYNHSVPAHIHLDEVGRMGQTISNYTNKYKENQKKS